jgi:hypothetical protein
MPAAQAPPRFIEGFTAKVYYWHRRAEGSVRCSELLDSQATRHRCKPATRPRPLPRALAVAIATAGDAALRKRRQRENGEKPLNA